MWVGGILWAGGAPVLHTIHTHINTTHMTHNTTSHTPRHTHITPHHTRHTHSHITHHTHHRPSLHPYHRYIPFSGGPRKCVGDQFALMEAVVALACTLKQYDFSLVPNQTIGMTTGATIHTTNGLYMNVKKRSGASSASSPAPAAALA